MSKYVIHACVPRMWYVNDYLIPSLKSQGIPEADIDIRCDRFHRGNLDQCMQIFSVMNGDGGSWHLQDDVLVCGDFKERTEKYDEYGLVCGFCWKEDDNRDKVGFVPLSDMWWSFPCVRIPNQYARECSRWFYEKARYNPNYSSWLASGQYDDYFFLEFMKNFYPDEPVFHVDPCLVEHVDKLIGGTMVKRVRNDEKWLRANNFADQDLVSDLEKKLFVNQNNEETNNSSNEEV